MPSLPSVLVVSGDTIGPNMAGSGIRYWQIASMLGRQQPVTLTMPNEPGLDPPPGVAIVPYGPGDWVERGQRLAALVAEHEVIVCQLPPYQFVDPAIFDSRFIAVDLYAPWYLEKLEYARIDPVRGIPNRQSDLDVLKTVLGLGDFYFCASERQRDLWLGALMASGRLDPAHYNADPMLRTVIDIVPFGLPTATPIPNGPGPRDVFPAIGANDPVILWNGGIWNWLDPFTAIRAVHLLAGKGVPCRLVFMGVRSPGSEIPAMERVDRARALARELDLEGSHVFFNDWVPYDQRQNWLMQSTMTISLHEPTVEARFAFRTRVLDNLWCRVPIIATDGDVLADMATTRRLGEVVPPGDEAAVAAAIERLLDRQRQHEVRQRLATVAGEYTWERAVEPLAAYCANPWRNRAGREQSEQVARIEQLFQETSEYARRLEAGIRERDEALRAMAERQSRGALRKLGDRWRDRSRRWRA